MISHIDIKNYRCLRDVSVPLKPLTVLIGANDTGKSTFLHAICVLFADGYINYSDFWRGDPASIASIVAESTSGRLELQHHEATGWKRPDEIKRLTFGPLSRFQLPSSGISMVCPGSSEKIAPALSEDGSNVAALLDFFLRHDRERFFEVERVLRSLIPGFNKLDIPTPNPSDRAIALTIENGYSLMGDRASAGLRLLLFFVALAYHPSPRRLILVEEPESGVHPRRLIDVINLLRQISNGEHASNAAQVILTTHSPYLLDLIDTATDQVLVFRREDDGSRSATPVDSAGLSEFLNEFKLGEVWYNEGEDRLIGKPNA